MAYSATVADSLGAYLRKARLARGLRLRAVAGKLGVTPGYVSDVELGRRMPSEALMRKLAGLLGLELGELLERAGRLDGATEEYLRRTPEAVRLVRKLAELRLRGPELEELARLAEGLRRKRRGTE